MRFLLTFFCILFSVCAYAQEEYHNTFILRVTEPDAPRQNKPEKYIASVRIHPVDTSTPINGRVPQDDLFTHQSYSNQAEILSLKKERTELETSFVYQQQPLAELPDKEKKAMLEHLIYTRKSLTDQYHGASNEAEQNQIYAMMNSANLNEYDMMSDIFPGYYCRTADDQLMGLFLDTLWTDRMMVSNLDWLALTKCFVCQPKEVMRAMQGYSGESYRLYTAQIQRGMELIVANDMQYQELEQILNN